MTGRAIHLRCQWVIMILWDEISRPHSTVTSSKQFMHYFKSPSYDDNIEKYVLLCQCYVRHLSCWGLTKRNPICMWEKYSTWHLEINLVWLLHIITGDKQTTWCDVTEIIFLLHTFPMFMSLGSYKCALDMLNRCMQTTIKLVRYANQYHRIIINAN